MDPVVEKTPVVTKIRAPLLEALNKGKPADIVISFKIQEPLDDVELDQNAKSAKNAKNSEQAEEVLESEKIVESPESPNGVEEVKTLPPEIAAILAESMKVVIDILEKQKDRFPITWKLSYETNKITVNGADMKLIEEIATVEHVEYVDEKEVSDTKKPKLWKKFKSVWKSKK